MPRDGIFAESRVMLPTLCTINDTFRGTYHPRNAVMLRFIALKLKNMNSKSLLCRELADTFEVDSAISFVCFVGVNQRCGSCFICFLLREVTEKVE